MAGLLPSTPDLSSVDRGEPRVIGVDSEAADELLSALSSGTARRLLARLHEEPATPSALANRVGTSIQNVQYHLEKLERADLVEVVDTCYSEKGREMSVYAPTDQPLVVFAGREEQATGLKAALSRLFGALGVLGLASLVIEYLFGAAWESAKVLSQGSGDSGGQATSSGGGGAGGGVSMSAQSVESAAAAESAAGLPPGLLFFAGGAAVLLVGFAVWYWRSR